MQNIIVLVLGAARLIRPMNHGWKTYRATGVPSCNFVCRYLKNNSKSKTTTDNIILCVCNKIFIIINRYD